MKRSSKTLIVFSCIFVTIAALFLMGEALFIGASFNALYKPDADLGDAIGGIFIYIYGISRFIRRYVTNRFWRS